MLMRNTAVLFLLFLAETCLADSLAELQSQAEELIRQGQRLEQEVKRLRAAQESDASNPSGDLNTAREAPALVDLSVQQREAIDTGDGASVVENPWWRNFTISGFGAAGYYDTGSDGTRPYGGFEIKEASLFFEADVWDNIAFFLEFQTNRLGKDDDLFTRTGEVYIHFRDLLAGDDISLGAKIGRFDIPFGEEYLWQDAIDNPLITNSAAYVYGWDEGILLYGGIGGFNWIAAISDGTDARSIEENSDKAFNLKMYGNALESLYLSLSLMTNGDGSKSAVEFGGSHFQPVGASHFSTVGTSPSTEVDAHLAELNAKYSFSIGTGRGYLALSIGAATQDDAISSFDRDILWFSAEPYFRITSDWYTVVRYSEIGTYDASEGYHFDGKTFAGGNSAFGYDTKRFRRLGVGLGWTPNPRTKFKLEIGKDRFDLIDASTLPNNGSRNFFGAEVAVGFQ